MITENTVFILGAGASKPYGFPTGEELRNEIIERYVDDVRTYVENNPRIRETPKALLPQELRKAGEFVEAFEKSPVSIDLFIATNPMFREAGKRAIVFRILKAERGSSLQGGKTNKEHDWLSYLFQRMIKGIYKKEDYKKFSENEVSFITFNYDRSLEQFLYESFTSLFKELPNDELLKELEEVEIVHVFGKLADLDWQNKEDRIAYKRDINSVNVQNLAKNIRTIYEEYENPELENVKGIIKNAERIFFLGFGYATENMDVLDIPKDINVYTKVYGTMLNFIDEEIERTRNYFIEKTVSDSLALKNAARFKEGFVNTDCMGLLRKFL